MDLNTLNNIFLFTHIGTGALSYALAHILTKKTKEPIIGFLSLFLVTAITLGLSITWYNEKAAELAIGTIPFVFNIVSTFVIYPIYLLVCFLILKRVKSGMDAAVS